MNSVSRVPALREAMVGAASAQRALRSGAPSRTVNSPGHQATASLTTPMEPPSRRILGALSPSSQSASWRSLLECSEDVPISTCSPAGPPPPPHPLANCRLHPSSAFTFRNRLISRLCCGVSCRSDAGWSGNSAGRLDAGRDAPLAFCQLQDLRRPRLETPSLWRFIKARLRLR